MNLATMTVLIWIGSLLAGLLGALTGLGGGVVIVPMLTLGFGVDVHYAIGASLVSVIATSSGAASAYVKEGYSNVRIGMFLEIATTIGALLGALLAPLVATNVLYCAFGIILIVSAYLTIRPGAGHREAAESSKLALALRLPAAYPTSSGPKKYNVTGVIPGFCMMFVAGVVSALLGIGSGPLKVLALDQLMAIPFKVSTTTSNFMIGVTASASTGVYLGRGYVDPVLAMPVMLGVLIGALLGARLLGGMRVSWLRWLFALVIFALAIQMILRGLGGKY